MSAVLIAGGVWLSMAGGYLAASGRTEAWMGAYLVMLGTLIAGLGGGLL